jgi:hypothetical protein
LLWWVSSEIYSTRVTVKCFLGLEVVLGMMIKYFMCYSGIMACLERIAIQGIRSFGPEDTDLQRIKFHSPLTLILGQNGCGKTTIIESLKYAVSGDLPPGAKQGQLFVHDPKISRKVEVSCVK